MEHSNTPTTRRSLHTKLRAYERHMQLSNEAILTALQENTGLEDRKELRREAGKLSAISIRGSISSVLTRRRSRSLSNLAIFGCEVLLLPGLFTDDNDHTDKEAWLKREMSLLESLKRKLNPQGRTRRPLTTEETAFLDALDEDSIRGYHQRKYMVDI
ncbi:hypothetical protein ACHAP5_009364 [Fusarium lateritium]